MLATDGGIAVADSVLLTSVDKAIANGTYTVAQVTSGTTIAIGAGGGLRGLGVAAAISVSGTLAPTSLSMCNLSSVVTPAAKTDLNSVEVYRSKLRINGLAGVAGAFRAPRSRAFCTTFG